MFWHLGILAFWHSGILAFWHFGILAFWHFEILSSFSKGGEACFKKIFPLARAFKDIGTPAPQGDPGAGFSSNLGDRYATEGPRERLVKYFESPVHHTPNAHAWTVRGRFGQSGFSDFGRVGASRRIVPWKH